MGVERMPGKKFLSKPNKLLKINSYLRESFLDFTFYLQIVLSSNILERKKDMRFVTLVLLFF